MGLEIVEKIVATSRVTGNEKIRLLLEDGVKLECTAIACTATYDPAFSVDESSWTHVLHEGFRELSDEWMGHRPSGERRSKRRFVTAVSELITGVPLELKLNASFEHDPQLRTKTAVLAPIASIELI